MVRYFRADARTDMFYQTIVCIKTFKMIHESSLMMYDTSYLIVRFCLCFKNLGEKLCSILTDSQNKDQSTFFIQLLRAGCKLLFLILVNVSFCKNGHNTKFFNFM